MIISEHFGQHVIKQPDELTLPAGFDFSEEQTQRLIAESSAKLAARPVKRRYVAALEGSTTEHGGTVVGASSSVCVNGTRVALVGDAVRYPDGTVARIVSGAGACLINHGRCVALVGSELDNGDWIVGPEHTGLRFTEYADGPPIKGLFDRNYVPLQHWQHADRQTQ
jgi:uncharacterized Zn-binding protein involved in type VI secretion